MVLEVADLALRKIQVNAEPTYIHLVAEGFDESTHRPVPPQPFGFLIEFSDGVPTLTPKTLEECGFTR